VLFYVDNNHISSVFWGACAPWVLTRRGGKILLFLFLLVRFFWKQNWGRGGKGQQNEANLSKKGGGKNGAGR
jgi:hypothetical protein